MSVCVNDSLIALKFTFLILYCHFSLKCFIPLVERWFCLIKRTYIRRIESVSFWSHSWKHPLEGCFYTFLFFFSLEHMISSQLESLLPHTD